MINDSMAAEESKISGAQDDSELPTAKLGNEPTLNHSNLMKTDNVGESTTILTK